MLMWFLAGNAGPNETDYGISPFLLNILDVKILICFSFSVDIIEKRALFR